MNVVYDQTIPEGGLALCIRKGAGGVRAHDVDFADWGLVEGRGVQKGHEHLANIGDPNVDAIKELKNAVQQGCNILISGATPTGQTTLYNPILEYADPRTRTITAKNKPKN